MIFLYYSECFVSLITFCHSCFIVKVPNYFLSQELEEIVSRNRELAGRLEECREQLAEQKQRFEALQSKHAEELEEMRQAGHQSLALIVEEYKVFSFVTNLILCVIYLLCKIKRYLV